MKLVVIARAKNEEHNIERFINSYTWADEVIVLDGGSEDNTINIAEDLGAVVYTFSERVERNDVSRNPHGRHWNTAIYLADWFHEADWIIHDDVDCVPNNPLQEHGRMLIEGSDCNFIYMTRVYMYKDMGYASKMSNVDGEWKQSLWAWKAGNRFHFSENDQFSHTFSEPDERNILRIKPPYALLHYPWPDDETIEKKRLFYNAVYDRKTAHPLHYCGAIKELDWWMKDD